MLAFISNDLDVCRVVSRYDSRRACITPDNSKLQCAVYQSLCSRCVLSKPHQLGLRERTGSREKTRALPTGVLRRTKDGHGNVDELLLSRLCQAAELFANQALIQRDDFAHFDN